MSKRLANALFSIVVLENSAKTGDIQYDLRSQELLYSHISGLNDLGIIYIDLSIEEQLNYLKTNLKSIVESEIQILSMKEFSFEEELIEYVHCSPKEDINGSKIHFKIIDSKGLILFNIEKSDANFTYANQSYSIK